MIKEMEINNKNNKNNIYYFVGVTLFMTFYAFYK
jgi:hypothetical protein